MKKILATLTILITLVAIGVYKKPQRDTVGATTAIVDSKQIDFAYTDDNVGEDLIIRSNKDTYTGDDVLFNIKNTSTKDQNVKIQIAWEGNEQEISDFKEFKPKNPYTVSVPQYGSKTISCKTNWTAAANIGSKDFELLSGFYKCGEQLYQCESVSGKSCFTNAEIGRTTETRYRDEWVSINNGLIEDLKSANVKQIDSKFVTKNQYTTFIKAGETKLFKASVRSQFKLKSDPVSRGNEFYINAYGDQGSVGHLDPWYDSTYSKCSKLTLVPNGATGGFATTSTAGFVILATSTITDFRATSSGGYIEELSSDNKRPFDAVITNGTDCNSDGGTKLDHYFESYSSTTGAFVVHFEHFDISSTTNKYALMYWGKDGSTDQSNETGTYDSTYVGVWNFNESPLTVLDSTSNNHDASSLGGFTATTTGKINGAGTSVTGYVDLGSSPLDGLTRFTISGWTYDAGSAASTAFFSDFSTAQTLWRWDFVSDLRLIVYWSDASASDNSYTATGWGTNKWVKFEATYDGTTLRMFSNATQNATAAASGKTVKTHTGTNTQNFGGGATGSEGSWVGKLDNYRIRNIALHWTDIKTNYNLETCNACAVTFGATETQTAGTVTPDRNRKLLSI